jgi:hypothetical protein
MQKLPDLSIVRAIVHRIIPKEELTEHATIEQTSNLISMSAEIKDMIIKRINTAVRNEHRTFALSIERTDADSFFGQAQGLSDVPDAEFIGRSQVLAANLARAQKTSSIPGGYFILLEGRYGDEENEVVIAIKAEPHEALRHTIDDTGRSRLEMLKSVFLSPSQKLFKIGVLYQHEEIAGDEINDIYGCLVYDAQFRTENSPAEYFFKDFLGLTTHQNARIQSKRFYEKTKEFAQQIDEPEFDLVAFDESLRLELANQEDLSISPTAFAERHFAQEDVKTDYIRQVADFMPETFEKDPGLIYHQLSTRKIEFDNRIRITGPADAFERSVEVMEQTPEYTVVRIFARRKS